MTPSVTTDVPSSYRSNELDIEIFLVNFLECTQSVVQCLGSALVSGWYQTASSATAKFGKTLQIRICGSGTPYEQDPEHGPSSGPRQLYSLDTVFG